MRKNMCCSILLLLPILLFCDNSDMYNVVKVLTWEEFMGLDCQINALRGENVSELVKKFGNPSKENDFIATDKWLNENSEYCRINNFGDVKILENAKIKEIVWFDTKNIFFILSQKMDYAVKHCYFQEVDAVEQDGEWIVFASRRSVASFEEPN